MTLFFDQQTLYITTLNENFINHEVNKEYTRCAKV
jgi:hypothetical protein